VGSFAAPARSDDKATFVATAPLAIEKSVDRCLSITGFTYDSFIVTVTANGLEGHAEGTYSQATGDTLAQYDAVLTMTGRIDDVPPTLAPDRSEVEPLLPFNFLASEPLPAGTTGKLIAGTDAIELEPVLAPASPLVLGFKKPPTLALRYGTKYDLVVTPWMDLAGNSGLPPSAVNTLPAPPLLPEDGFEGATDPIGDVPIIGVNRLPPITGTRSAIVSSHNDGLFALPSSMARLTVRLAVAPGDRVVRLAVRPFNVTPYGFRTDNFKMSVAVPGGSIVSVPLPLMEELATPHDVQLIDGQTKTGLFGATRTIEIPLPNDVGQEVILQAGAESFQPDCLPFHHARAAYLIDDLRVE
jgi:hypothetical protein